MNDHQPSMREGRQKERRGEEDFICQRITDAGFLAYKKVRTLGNKTNERTKDELKKQS